MTNVDERRTDGKNGASAIEEIEVTPEMIEAGERAIWGELCGSLPHPSFSADVLAKRVFLEMSTVARSVRTTQSPLHVHER
jgi:hypothetical protein